MKKMRAKRIFQLAFGVKPINHFLLDHFTEYLGYENVSLEHAHLNIFFPFPPHAT